MRGSRLSSRSNQKPKFRNKGILGFQKVIVFPKKEIYETDAKMQEDGADIVTTEFSTQTEENQVPREFSTQTEQEPSSTLTN